MKASPPRYTLGVNPTLRENKNQEKKMKIRTMGALVILLVCLISTVASADASYLCIGEHATGFEFDQKKKEWQVAKFKTQKLIVKKDPPGKGPWKVYVFGNNTPEVECGNDFIVDTTLICTEGFGTEFRMNKKNNRFLYFFYFGYWTDDKRRNKDISVEGEDTPAIEIGKCTEF